MKNLIQTGVRELFPGTFALVMATGIVSIACHLLNLSFIAQALFQINKAAFVLLWIFFLARLIFYPRDFFADLSNPARGPGYLTLVAGTCVLGSQYILINGESRIALSLWYLGFAIWSLLIYAFFILTTVKISKPGLETGINGSWLLIIVSTQSISVLGTLLAQQLGTRNEGMLFFTLAMYLLGAVLYLLVMTLIFYRWLFHPIKPSQMTPTYWISMGAVAISTLAGDNLILNAGQWRFLQELLPFLKGFNILLWATATFWIPLLILLGVWRHIYKRYSISYDPQFWGLVFPLGMYTVCTFQLAKALDISFLLTIPRVTIYFALLAWLIVFAELFLRLGQNLLFVFRSPPSPVKEAALPKE